MAGLESGVQVYKHQVIHGPHYRTAKTSDDVVSEGLIPSVNGSKRLDFKRYGAINTAYEHWDASLNEKRVYGPVRITGHHTALSKRFELIWRAGERGKPNINADMASGTEATREPSDPNFEILGTNVASTTSAFYAEGGIVLTTTTGAADSVILLPHLDTNQSGWANVTWGTDQQTEWECFIGSNATITNEVLYAGLKLTNTDVTATDDDQCFFRYAPATNSGKWQAIYSIGGTDTATDSGVTVAASTNYHLKIAIDSSRIARMYIDGVLVNTSTALTNATDLIPYIGVLNSTGSAHAIRVYAQSISRVLA